MKTAIVNPTLVPKPASKPMVTKAKRTVKAPLAAAKKRGVLRPGTAPGRPHPAGVKPLRPAPGIVSAVGNKRSATTKPVVARIAPRTALTHASRITLTTTTPAVIAAPQTRSAPVARSIWYLGGNQTVKLLTSVEGDLDHHVLAKIAAVPSVVGDLALSVESLVSDDVTVGGFESDLLARIAANTLASKQGEPLGVLLQPVAPAPARRPAHPVSVVPRTASAPGSTRPVISKARTATHSKANRAQPVQQQRPTQAKQGIAHSVQPQSKLPRTAAPAPSGTPPQVIAQAKPAMGAVPGPAPTTASKPGTTTADPYGSVPDPLASYKPVPNPLARITPPASPHEKQVAIGRIATQKVKQKTTSAGSPYAGAAPATGSPTSVTTATSAAPRR